MTFETQLTNNKKEAQAWLNGRYVTAQKGNDGWYAIVDGKRVKLDQPILKFAQNDLTELPEHYVNYYSKQFKESEEKKKELKIEGNFLRAKLEGLKEDYNKFLARIGVKDLNQISNESQRMEALKYTSDIAGIKSAYRRNGFDFQWECMKGFDAALERGEWQNQLALAERVQDSFGLG